MRGMALDTRWLSWSKVQEYRTWFNIKHYKSHTSHKGDRNKENITFLEECSGIAAIVTIRHTYTLLKQRRITLLKSALNSTGL